MNAIAPRRDFNALIPAVLSGVSDNTKDVYARSLRQFFAWFEDIQPSDGLSRTTIMAYRDWLLARKLAPSTVNLALSAIKRLVAEAAANGWMDEAHAYHCQKVKSCRVKPLRLGRWLNLDESLRILEAPPADTLVGKRDRAALWLMLGCGLRIEEACTVQVEQIEEVSGRVVLRDVAGKGEKRRLVPVPANGYKAIYDWLQAAGIESGPILRTLERVKGNEFVLQGDIDPNSLRVRVTKWARSIGLKITPHDLRRTFGGLARHGGAEIGMIQRTYGHASSDTTDRYLGNIVDLEVAPCDLTGL